MQYDQQLTLNVRHGQQQGSASTRELDDESLKAAVDEAQEAAHTARARWSKMHIQSRDGSKEGSASVEMHISQLIDTYV